MKNFIMQFIVITGLSLALMHQTSTEAMRRTTQTATATSTSIPMCTLTQLQAGGMVPGGTSEYPYGAGSLIYLQPGAACPSGAQCCVMSVIQTGQTGQLPSGVR